MTFSKRTWFMVTLGCLLATIGGCLLLLAFPPGPKVREVRFGKHDILVGEAIPLEVQLVLPWGETPAQVDLSMRPGSQLRLIGRTSKLQSVGLGSWEWMAIVTLQAVQAGTVTDEYLQISFSCGEQDCFELEPISARWPEVAPGFAPMVAGAAASTPSPLIFPYFVGFLVAAGVGLVLILFSRASRTLQADTALTVALSSLESLRELGEEADKLGQAVGLHLRIYLSKRTGRNVEAMTAAELDGLQDLLPVGLLNRLQELCRHIDQTKYAPKSQDRELNPELLGQAMDWLKDCDAALRREEGDGV